MYFINPACIIVLPISFETVKVVSEITNLGPTRLTFNFKQFPIFYIFGDTTFGQELLLVGFICDLLDVGVIVTPL